MNVIFLTIIIYFLVITVTIIGDYATFATTNSSDLTFSIDSEPYGVNYSSYQGIYWQWLINTTDQNDPGPKTETSSAWHPRYAYTPEKCSWNQFDENVWFLPDGKSLSTVEYNLGKLNPGYVEERSCTVPHDRAILIQIYGGGCDYSELNLKTDEDLENCAHKGLNEVKLSVKVDGIEIMNTANKLNYLPEMYEYNITYPENNVFLATPGIYEARAHGYYLFLKPLSIGDHTIEIDTEYLDPGDFGQDSSEHKMQNLIYYLTIV
jgi:hypothetical protein